MAQRHRQYLACHEENINENHQSASKAWHGNKLWRNEMAASAIGVAAASMASLNNQQ
jgi:anti-sigma-K factor RskA